ncbi:MAG: guanylate kinase [Lachnospiraceae bacterium]|nr:guanylate kinase [Lachnospiraceae bacterium]
MGKIFYVMGKSATGKDTVYNRLLEDPTLPLKTVVLYTTRPIRVGETDGVTYHFRDIPWFKEQEKTGKVIESRVYPTMLGPWYYFTMDDGQIDLTKNSYLMIGTPEGCVKMRAYFGEEPIVPIYLSIDDGERLRRAWARECNQKKPRFDEVCRRYLADEEDFAPDKLLEAGITRTFCNDDVDTCCEQVKAMIRERL